MKTKVASRGDERVAKRDANGRIDLWRSVLALLRRRTSRQAGILTAAQYVTVVLGLVTVTVSTRLLGPPGYGSAALIMAYPSLIRSLLEFKSISVVTRYIANFQGTGRTEEIGGIVKAGYLLDLAVALLAVAVVGLTGAFMGERVFRITNLGWLAIAYALFFPFASLKKTSTSVLTSYGEFTWIAVFNVADRVLALILITSVLVAGYKVHGYVLANGIVIALTGIAMSAVTLRVLSRRVGPDWFRVRISTLRPMARELAAFFGWNNLITTLAAAANQAPVLVLGYLAGKEAAGFFKLAKTIMTTGSYPEDSLRTVTFPVIAKRWAAGERRTLWSQLRRWTLTGGLPVAGIPLLAAVVAPFVVPALFGPGFGNAVTGIQLMLVGSAAGSAIFWLKPLYYAAGQTKRWAMGYALYAVAALGLGWVATSRAGFAGMAAVSALGDAAFVLLMAAWAYGRIGR
ncbi:MAG TPA: oligosaccharide flippase family protein [bacterium]|nr:oligosaccharide flippase family protein [bacterium]